MRHYYKAFKSSGCDVLALKLGVGMLEVVAKAASPEMANLIAAVLERSNQPATPAPIILIENDWIIKRVEIDNVWMKSTNINGGLFAQFFCPTIEQIRAAGQHIGKKVKSQVILIGEDE